MPITLLTVAIVFGLAAFFCGVGLPLLFSALLFSPKCRHTHTHIYFFHDPSAVAMAPLVCHNLIFFYIAASSAMTLMR